MAVNKNKKYVCLALNLNKDLGREVHGILENLKDESKQHYIMRAIKYFHDHEKQIKQLEALETFNIDPESFTKIFLSIMTGESVELPKGSLNKKGSDQKKETGIEKKKRQGKESTSKPNQKKEEKPVEKPKANDDAEIIYGDDLDVDPAKLDLMIENFDNMFN
jgi:hypothetical protein